MAAFWSENGQKRPKRGSNPVFSTLDGSRARARCAQRIPGPQRGPLENFRPFERAQEIFHRGARPIKSSMGKPKLGRISRSAYNRSRITRITILLQRITSPYVRPKPANLRTRRYLGPVATRWARQGRRLRHGRTTNVQSLCRPSHEMCRFGRVWPLNLLL